MRPADALYRSLTGRSRKSEQSYQAAMSELERQHGSKKAAAAAAGVADRTWRDWRAGTHRPSKAHRSGLQRAQREARLRPSKADALGGVAGAGGVVAKVTGQIRCSSDSRNRSVSVPLPDDLAQQILTAYEAGDDAAMEAALQEAVDEAFGRSVELEDVSSVQLA
jgi:hypothetical protein